MNVQELTVEAALTGKELMEKGLTLTLTDKPGSALIKYKRVH